MVLVDREFLLIKRQARRRALYNALTCGPVVLLHYAVGRAAFKAEYDLILFGATDPEFTALRIVSLHRKLTRVKTRLGL